MTLRLKPTKDIAACLGQMKQDRQVLVGFALETNDEQHNAEDKLQRKNLDFIVLNSLNDKGAGFQYDTNKISIIDCIINSHFQRPSASLYSFTVKFIEQRIRLSDGSF